MLNELFLLERGLTAAGVDVAPRHSDVSSPGRADALQIRLDKAGQPVEVTAISRDRVAGLWTLRDGKHNSFPYMQLKQPLLSVPPGDAWRKMHTDRWKRSTPQERRRYLHDLAHDHPALADAVTAITGSGLRGSLAKRRHAVITLAEPHACIPAVIERTLAIRDAAGFAAKLRHLLLSELDQGDEALLEAANILLTGRIVQGKVMGSPLLLDVVRGEFMRDVADPRHAGAISEALSEGSGGSGACGRCLLTGVDTAIHTGNFPQPKLPILGQIYCFSKNGDIPAAFRYGHADANALPVSSALVQALAGTLDAITKTEWEGRTWRGIPGERPKTRDLMIAFVHGAPEAPMADLIAGDDAEEDDATAEETGHLDQDEVLRLAAAAARGRFLTRAERVVKALEGRVGVDFRDTPGDRPVAVLVLRKVDTGNAKAILHRALTVGNLYDAAKGWAEALDNVPSWLRMPVPRPGKGMGVRQQQPPSLTPLLLPRITQSLFVRGGSERAKREPVGITAADALTLFLGEAGAARLARATLRIVLARQGSLLSGSAHALQRDAGGELKAARKFDRAAALQAATLLGALLAKLGHKRDDYMSRSAFQLGQLLAVADAIHISYCMDVRDQQVPPALLGNAVFQIAQTDPQRALSVLCRRWKPYWVWVLRTPLRGKPTTGQWSRKDRAINSAIFEARQVSVVADQLGRDLPDLVDVDDAFRAKLLLGYVAGLPPSRTERDTKKLEGAE